MLEDNRISITIDAAKLQAAREKLAGLRTDLQEVLIINLTGDERQQMLKMGDKTLAFVGKALEFAQQNPTLAPPYMNLEEAQRDFELAGTLNELLKEVITLGRGLEDTTMVAGGEAYNAALMFYASVKGASRTNVAGSEAIYNELKERFPGARRSKPAPGK